MLLLFLLHGTSSELSRVDVSVDASTVIPVRLVVVSSVIAAVVIVIIFVATKIEKKKTMNKKKF